MSGARKAFAGVGLLIASILASVFAAVPTHASTGINTQLAFEGKVVKSDGTNVADGTYNMEFKIYQDGTGTGGGTLKWQEDYRIGGTGGITVTSGTFEVNLGSVCGGFAASTCDGHSNAGVDFNQTTLYLSMQVGNTSSCTITTNFQSNCGGDGEMTPYIRLTAVPQAMNANTVGGLSASQLVQLSPGSQQTGTINVSGNIASGGTLQANTLDAATSGTLTLGGTNATGITLSDSLTAASGITMALQGASALSLGSSGNAGGINFNDSAGHTITLNVASGVAYTLTLPTALASTGNCLTAGSVAGSAITAAWASCGGSSSLQAAYNGGSTITEVAGTGISITSSTNVPTVDQLSIDNTGSTGVVTAGVNALNIHYKGGAAAVEAAGMRLDYTPGATSGGTWSGLRIIESVPAGSGIASYGLKLEGGGTGSGSSYGIEVASGWDIGIDVQSGGLQLAAQSDPATPAANNLRIYAKSIAGRVLPKWIGPAGVDTPFQANFGFNRIAMVMPAGGTTMTNFGTTNTNVGTVSNPAPASTSLFTSVRKVRLTSSATAGSLASHTQTNLMAWRGNASSLGGFFFTIRFGLATLQSGNRAFVGLSDSTSAPTNVDPTTNATPGRLGMAINANTGNWNWINNVTGTAPTVTGLGASFPVNNTDLYELVIFCPPNGSTITYRITDLSTGGQVTNSVSTNVPAATTFLAPQYWMTNNATAATVAIDNGGWYLESDN